MFNGSVYRFWNLSLYAADFEKKLLLQQDWSRPTEEYLSFSEWVREREQKDFKAQFPQFAHSESFGRVLSCLGQCRHFRDNGFSLASFRSEILEGDDLTTDADASTYVYLHGGHLLRLAPNTSISFKEINVSANEEVAVIRLNQGHLLAISRFPLPIVDQALPETDRIFLPLHPLEANLLPQDIDPKEETFEPEKILVSYIKKINLKIESNNKLEKKPRKFYLLLILPNGTLWTESPILEAYVTPGDASFFKTYSSQLYHPSEDIQRVQKVALRGYTQLELQQFPIGAWMKIVPDGRTLEALGAEQSILDLGKMLFARPWSIFSARELFYEKYDLNQNLQGHFIWKDLAGAKNQEKRPDLYDRLIRTFDLTRRWETYNLPLIVSSHPRTDTETWLKELVRKYHDRSFEALAKAIGGIAVHNFVARDSGVSENWKWWYLESQLKGRK